MFSLLALMKKPLVEPVWFNEAEFEVAPASNEAVVEVPAASITNVIVGISETEVLISFG